MSACLRDDSKNLWADLDQIIRVGIFLIKEKDCEHPTRGTVADGVKNYPFYALIPFDT